MTSFKIPIGTNKFDSLILVENGLILNSRNKGKKEIPFSELNKIYLKKYKIYPIFELLLFIFFPFILVYIGIQYFPFELPLIAALFTFIPVFIAFHNYKWYRLTIHLKNGTTFIKNSTLIFEIREYHYCEKN